MIFYTQKVILLKKIPNKWALSLFQFLYMVYYFIYIFICPSILLLSTTSNLLRLLLITFRLDNQVAICCSIYAMGQVGPVNGTMTMGASKPQSTTPVSSTTSKSAKDYDFSSLTQGMFAKPWLVFLLNNAMSCSTED